VKRFGKQNKHTLLLLTKSSNVNGLLKLKHNGMTVVGFSINPQAIVSKYELGTSATNDRLDAVGR
jgi:spore photoproduct lyase